MHTIVLKIRSKFVSAIIAASFINYGNCSAVLHSSLQMLQMLVAVVVEQVKEFVGQIWFMLAYHYNAGSCCTSEIFLSTMENTSQINRLIVVKIVDK